MNREIIFKAKTTKKNDLKHEFNEKWVEGNLILCGGKAYIHPVSNKIDVTGEIGRIIVMHEVDPETLCQHTGLTDKNGKRIWENDIIELPGEGGYFVCEWQEDTARFVLNGEGLTVDFDNYWSYEVEVIGNIFDNADLLEVE